MSDYGPSIKVCRVYEKTSKNGNRYFVGRWGAARINILKSRETADDGTPIWEVLLQEAPQNGDRKAPPPLANLKRKKSAAQAQKPWVPAVPAVPDAVMPSISHYRMQGRIGNQFLQALQALKTIKDEDLLEIARVQ